MRRFGEDFWLGAGLLALSLFGLVYLVPTEVGALGSDAALLPVVGTIALAILSALLMLDSAMRSSHSQAAAPAEGEERDGEAADRLPVITIGAIVAIMVVYAWILDWSGFLLSSLAAAMALLLVMGVRRPVHLAAIPLSIVTVIYVAFEIFLSAPLPEGRLIEPLLR